MDLYLIRHADAVPLGQENIHVDDERPLTQLGKDQCKTVSKALQKKGVTLQLILTSPLLRARQTGEDIAKAWNGTAPVVQVCDELTPGKRPRKLLRALKRLEGGPVALIGHEPDMSAWLGWIIGSRNAQLALAKAGVAQVSFDERPEKGAGTLVQLITPEWLE